MLKKNKHFLALIVLCAAFFGNIIPCLAQNSQGDVEIINNIPLTFSEPKNETPKLCGIYCLYVALRILGEGNLTFKQLLESFPKAQENGTTLNELKAFLENKNYFCKPLEMTDAELSSMGKAVLAFTLLNGHSQYPHLILKLPNGKDSIYHIDVSGKIQKYQKESFCLEPQFMLLVSKDPIKVEGETLRWLLVPSCFGITIIFLSLFVVTLLRKRKHEGIT